MPDNLLLKWLLSDECAPVHLARMAMVPADPLPPAEVTVTTDYNKLHVRIKRDGGSDRSYQGDGTNEGDRAKDAIKKILADPASIENISRG